MDAPRTEQPTESESTAKGSQTLDRGLSLLERVAEEPTTLAQLARTSELAEAQTRRLVKALLNRGFLAADRNRVLTLGPKLRYLGAVTRSQTDLIGIARPLLRGLSAQTGFCSFLGRREGDYSVHLHRSAGNRQVAVTTGPGARRLLAETGIGKALLLGDTPASWRDAYARAFGCVPPDEWEVGMAEAAERDVVLSYGVPPHSIRSIAAPIRDASGSIVAAISIASPAQYLDDAGMEGLVTPVRATAHSVSERLGWDGRLRN
jgi:DNA-binding IclR family transcriptional regulator